MSKKDLLAEFTEPADEFLGLKVPAPLFAELRAYLRARSIIEGTPGEKRNLSVEVRGLMAAALKRAAEVFGPWPRTEEEWSEYERRHAPKPAAGNPSSSHKRTAKAEK